MSGDELGPVQIGAREIYDAVQELRSDVRRLIDRHDDADERLDDHEDRLRSLERTRWPLPSLAVLLSAAALVLAFFTRS